MKTLYRWDEFHDYWLVKLGLNETLYILYPYIDLSNDNHPIAIMIEKAIAEHRDEMNEIS